MLKKKTKCLIIIIVALAITGPICILLVHFISIRISMDIGREKYEFAVIEARETFSQVREAIEHDIPTVIPTFLEIEEYNEGKRVEEWRRPPRTPEILEEYSYDYPLEVVDAMRRLFSLGFDCIEVESGAIYLTKRDGRFAYFVGYSYVYDHTLSELDENERIERLDEHWFFVHGIEY